MARRKRAGDKLYFCRNVAGKTKERFCVLLNGKGEKALIGKRGVFMNLGTVIQDKVNALPVNLQEEVLRYVERLASANRKIREATLEKEVASRLLAKGIISEISAPMSDAEDSEVELLTIEGEPLSETIIRERR